MGSTVKFNHILRIRLSERDENRLRDLFVVVDIAIAASVKPRYSLFMGVFCANIDRATLRDNPDCVWMRCEGFEDEGSCFRLKSPRGIFIRSRDPTLPFYT